MLDLPYPKIHQHQRNIGPNTDPVAKHLEIKQWKNSSNLNNFFKTGHGIFHENASRLRIDVEAVAVLPKVFQVFTVFENFDLFVIQNLANGTSSLRLPCLAEDAGDENGVDLGQGQVSEEAETRTEPCHEFWVEHIGRFKFFLLVQWCGRLLDFVNPLWAGLVKPDQGVVRRDGVFKFDVTLSHWNDEIHITNNRENSPQGEVVLYNLVSSLIGLD